MIFLTQQDPRKVWYIYSTPTRQQVHVADEKAQVIVTSRVLGITRSALARRQEGHGFDVRPKPRHI